MLTIALSHIAPFLTVLEGEHSRFLSRASPATEHRVPIVFTTSIDPINLGLAANRAPELASIARYPKGEGRPY